MVPLFICPTRRKATAFPDAVQQGAYNSAPSTTLNHTDYAASAGTSVSAAYPNPIMGDQNCMSSFPNCKWDTESTNGNGVVYEASQVTPGSITDGSSHTFFAGEKSLAPDNYNNSLDPGDNNSMLQGYDVRYTTLALLPVRDTHGVVNTYNQFGSAHSTGVHFVFCDGSVRIIPTKSNRQSTPPWVAATDGTVSEKY